MKLSSKFDFVLHVLFSEQLAEKRKAMLDDMAIQTQTIKQNHTDEVNRQKEEHTVGHRILGHLKFMDDNVICTEMSNLSIFFIPFSHEARYNPILKSNN